MKLRRDNYSTLQVQTKIKLPKSMSQLEPGPPFLLHFGFTVTTTLVSCHRHCKLQAVRMENTATWWKKSIGNICNCSKYKHSHRDVPSLPMPSELLKGMAGAAAAPPQPQPHPAHCQLPLLLWLNSQKNPKAKGDNSLLHLCLKTSIKDDMEVWNFWISDSVQLCLPPPLLKSSPFMPHWDGRNYILPLFYLFPLIHIFSSCSYYCTVYKDTNCFLFLINSLFLWNAALWPRVALQKHKMHLDSCTQNSLQARGFWNKPPWNVSGILKQQPHISVVRFLSHMITQIRATTA